MGFEEEHLDQGNWYFLAPKRVTLRRRQLDVTRETDKSAGRYKPRGRGCFVVPDLPPASHEERSHVLDAWQLLVLC